MADFNPFAFISGATPMQTQANANLDFSKMFEGQQQQQVPFQNFEQAIDYGLNPVDGMVYKGDTMPGTGRNFDPNAAKPSGTWEFIGNAATNSNGNPDHGPAQVGQWRYREAEQQAAPMQRPVQEEEPAPQPTDGKTIYNDWDTYQNKARDTTERYNYMAHVLDPALSPRDQTQSMQQLYPGAWQDEGVQKTIGPNGQNIAPELYKKFGDPQFIDTTKQDMPSLVSLLLEQGQIDGKQSQALLDLMKPKALNTSFAGMPGGGGGAAGSLLGGGFR